MMMHGAALRRTGARLGGVPCAGMLARRSVSTTPTERMKSLRQLMASQELVRMLEVHNGLTALVSRSARFGSIVPRAVLELAAPDRRVSGRGRADSRARARRGRQPVRRDVVKLLDGLRLQGQARH